MTLIEIPLFTASNETSHADRKFLPSVISPCREGKLLNADNILTIDFTVFTEWRKKMWEDEIETTPIGLTAIDMVGGSHGKLFYTSLTPIQLTELLGATILSKKTI